MPVLYPYERRPRFLDPYLNWRHTRNSYITHAPVIVLTGAGASVPVGVPTLALPPNIQLTPTLKIDTKALQPPADAFAKTEVFDLETLMIIASGLKSLPRRVIHDGMGSGSRERTREVLIATLHMLLPAHMGGTLLSQKCLAAVVDRLIALDKAHEGGVIDHLGETIYRIIESGCLQLARDRIVPVYAPLVKHLAGALQNNRKWRQHVTIPVFTTNYDETFELLTDPLAGRLSQEIGAHCTVFNSTVPLRDFPHWRVLRPAGYARFKPLQQKPFSINLVVFYLHGSISWSLSEKAAPGFTIYVADHLAARQVKYHRTLLPPDGQKVLYEKSKEALSDLFVPERKDPFRPGAPYYAMRLAYLYLQKCLRHAKAVLAIGYSFRDSDCRALLHEVWQRQDAPTLILLDPNPEPIVARLGGNHHVLALRGRFGDAAVLPQLTQALRDCGL